MLERNGFAKDENIQTENAVEISRQSRAENFITGSFARIGETIRLDVRLFDARTGEILAAETATVEKPEKIFSAIDLLSLKLTNHLDATPFERERQTNITGAMTGNLEAYRNYSLAVNLAQSLRNKEALALLEKAAALDNEFAMAYARIGYIYAVAWGFPDKAKPYLVKSLCALEPSDGKGQTRHQCLVCDCQSRFSRRD